MRKITNLDYPLIYAEIDFLAGHIEYWDALEGARKIAYLEKCKLAERELEPAGAAWDRIYDYILKRIADHGGRNVADASHKNY